MVVDDRVVVLDSGVPKNMRGKQGVVLWHHNNQCLVQFDEFVGGHDGGGVFGSPKGLMGHCYWILEKSLRLENNEEFREENPNKWWLEESAKWGSKRDNSREERNEQFFIGSMVKPKAYIADPMIGKTGKIIDIYGGFCLVEFEENFGGHNGSGHHAGGPLGKMGYCWWIPYQYLDFADENYGLGEEEDSNKWWLDEKLIINEKYENDVVFKIGDRVVGKCESTPQYGKFGTIVYIDKGFNRYLVEYDEYIDGHGGNTHLFKGRGGHCWWEMKGDINLSGGVDDKFILKYEEDSNKWWLDEKLLVREGKKIDSIGIIKDFKSGDRVVGSREHYPQYGKFGTIIIVNGNHYLVEYDENVGGHDGGNFEYKGKPGHCWWELSEDINLSGGVDDRFLLKDEEDSNKWWLEEGFLIKESSFNKIDMEKIHPVYIEFNSSREMRKIATYLDENGIRVVNYDSIMEEPMDDDYTFFKSVERDGYYQFVRTNKCDTYKTVSFDFFKKIKKRIKNKNIDPFDEEVWGFETNESIFSDAKLYQILIANKKEYDFVMKKLEEDGCLWNGGQLPTKWSYKGGRRILSIHNKKIGSTLDEDSDINYLIRSGIIPASEFLKYDNMKRKTNFDADPFGEENWGYEEMNESIFSDHINTINKNEPHTMNRHLRTGTQKLNYSILIKNQEEFDFVMEELEKDGFRWFGGQSPTKWPYKGGSRIVFVNDGIITCPTLDTRHITSDYFTGVNCLDASDFMINKIKIEEDEKDKWWLNENVSNENSFIMWHIYKKEGTWENVCDYLKNNLIGKFVKFNGYNMKERHDFMDFEKFVSNVVFTGSHFLFTCEDGEYTISLQDPIRILGTKKKKILDLENDPFGEENWGYEEMNESVKNYKDFLFEYEGGPPTKDPTKIGDRMITEIDIEEDDDEDEDNDGTLKVLNDEIRLDESRLYSHPVYKGDVPQNFSLDGKGYSYFTRDKDSAEYYTKSRVEQGISKNTRTIKAFLNIKNPLIINAEKPSPIPVYLPNGENIGYFSDNDIENKIINLGYDALIINKKFGNPMEGWEILVFDRSDIEIIN